MNYIITFIACVFVIAEGSDLDIVVNSHGVEVDAEKICLPGGRQCHIKCCADDQVIHLSQDFSMTCINLTEKRDRIDLSSIENKLKNYSAIMSTKKTNDLVLYRNKTEFRYGINVYVYTDDLVDVQNNVLVLKYDGGDIAVTPPKYCYEMLVAYDADTLKTVTYYAHLVNVDEYEKNPKIIFTAYGCLLSAFFIFLVLIVYYLLESLRSNVYSIILMWFLASLMMLQLIDSWTSIYEYWLMERGRDEEKLQVCPWLSPIVYYLVLSTFFWMNAMCFEIWRTFKKSTMVRSDSTNRRRRAKCLYALYALGCPAVLTAMAVIIDLSDLPPNISKPGFETCMHDTEDKMVRLYKFLPMGVLVSASLVLYGLTIHNIWTVNRMSQGMTTQNKKNKKQFAVYGRLAVLMGVNWMLGIIQMMIVEEIPMWLEFIIDLYDMFIGVVIFFTMVFKKSIFVLLCKRLNIENRWVRENTTKSSQSRSKASRSYARTKTTDDSIEFESIHASQALHKTSSNPRFTSMMV